MKIEFNGWQITIILCVAVIVIGILEGIALLKGINGTLLTAAIGSIVFIVGYVFGKKTPPSDSTKESFNFNNDKHN